MREPTGDRVPRRPLAPTPPAARIRLHDTTGQHGPAELDALSNHDEAELVRARERGQVRGSEGSVRHLDAYPAIDAPTIPAIAHRTSAGTWLKSMPATSTQVK